MQDTPFKIYDASAGSGKTYTLAKEYLKIILSNPKGYKQILAITFTNKAVNEMKHRILNNLYEFSLKSNTEERSPMFDELAKELKINALKLQQKSKIVLKEILHNYAFFDISTIDKFTHRLIRTFAKDLKLPQNFEVVLDIDLLLEEAVSRLINKAGKEQKLTKVLIDFALEKIDDDKSWDIAYDLNTTGRLLFNETNATHLKKIGDKEIDDFLSLQKIILKNINSIEANAQLHAEDVLRLIFQHSLETTDFPRETLPNHFKKIIDGVFEPAKLYNNKLEENLMVGKILKSGINLPSAELPSKILNAYLDIKKLIYKRGLLKNVYKNVVPLTVLNAIQKEVKTIELERDQLSISEFNTIISNEIKDQPAPFIYERLGEKYRHYFIDEFQDTSEMQWGNLIPLVGNAIESEDVQGNKGSLFLVGDAKQAIYRWRGGKAEQFLNMVNLKTNPFVLPPYTQNLLSNYRSHDEIIKFNNDFFTLTSSFLNNKTYHTLFEVGNKQLPNTKKGGVVQITFLDKDEGIDINTLYCTEVLNTITEVKDKKYNYKDICILVRGNKEGVLLANFLTQEQIPVLSSESLLLKSNPKIKFLINLAHYHNQPKNLEIAYELLSFLAFKEENQHDFIVSHLENIATLISSSYYFDINRIKQLSAYDAFEYAIKQFDLAPESDAYVNHFMDNVLDVEQKEGTSIQTFLAFWEKKKDKLSITAPSTIDAVQIMTIHKSKGLEFPIVVYPYANSNIYKEIEPKLWLPVAKNDFNGFDEVLISKKQEVVNYNETAEALYANDQFKLELDAFNILYVATTRAVKALYIITKKDLTRSGAHKTDYYSGLFIHYLKEKNLWNELQNRYTFGKLDICKEDKGLEAKEHIPYQYSYKERPSFKILTKSSHLWDTNREEALSRGNLIHFIMSLIETEKDVERTFDIVLRNGDISIDEIGFLKDKIYQILQHSQLKKYYQEGNIIKNETDIITQKGKILRPDRVVLKNDTATIIDYKTGRSNPSYKEQIYGYADALIAMGYQVENKIIVYINETINLDFF